MRSLSTRCAPGVGRPRGSRGAGRQRPARVAAACPTNLLAPRCCLLQSNIETTGYRSLKEGEEVEFDLVVADDGKKKAFRVTGPDGAPPQARLLAAWAQA